MSWFGFVTTLAATTVETKAPFLPNEVWDTLCRAEAWTSPSLTAPLNVLRIGLALAVVALFVRANRLRGHNDRAGAKALRIIAAIVGTGLALLLVVPPSMVTEYHQRYFADTFCKKSGFELFLLRVRVGLPVTLAALLILAARARRLQVKISPRLTRPLAIAFTATGFLAYYDFFHPQTRYREYYHRHEFYHYYLGSKYFREINYTRLYECTLVAEVELGREAAVRARDMRDLTRNLITPVTKTNVLTAPEKCKQHFTPERWEAWKKDVDWFQRSSAGDYWNNMQKDHGYNPPPVWTMAGKFISELAPAGDRFFKILALLDIGFQLGMLLLIGWAFGFNVMAIAAVWWGCNAPANLYWTGGAFMRQDWIFLLVAAACLARKQRFALAGAALTWSALLRVFPLILFAGPALIMLAHLLRAWRAAARSGSSPGLLAMLHPSHKRFLVGCIAAAGVLVPTSMAVAGPKSYLEFAAHIRVHKNTPLTNHMGLETVLSHNWEGRMRFARDDNLEDPFEGWKRGRLERFSKMKPAYYATTAVALFLLFWSVKRTRLLWIGIALSPTLVVCLLNLTCYYYCMFILVALLARLRPQLMPAYLAVSAGSQILLNQYYWFDDKFTALSWLFLILSFLLLFSYSRPLSLGSLRAFWRGEPEPSARRFASQPRPLPST